MQLAPYLFFDGTCEEALAFYAEVFGGTTQLSRWGDAPGGDDMADAAKNRIMHATFVAPGVTFMASDIDDLPGRMHRVSLSLAMPDAADGARLFAALADGGTIETPYARAFWGASFGMLTDRFGVSWMVNAG